MKNGQPELLVWLEAFVRDSFNPKVSNADRLISVAMIYLSVAKIFSFSESAALSDGQKGRLLPDNNAWRFLGVTARGSSHQSEDVARKGHRTLQSRLIRDGVTPQRPFDDVRQREKR